MKHYSRCCIILMLLMSACTSGNSKTLPTDDRPDTPDARIMELLPPLPPTDSPRSAAAVEVIDLHGSQTYRYSPNAVPNGFGIELRPGAGQISWAMYQFHVAGNQFSQIDVVSTIIDVDKVWFAISNYTDQQWSLNLSADNPSSIQVQGLPASESGNCYVAVIAYDHVSTSPTAIVHSLSLTIDQPDWQIHTIDGNDSPGLQSAAVNVDGTVYVAYSATDGDIRLARATVPDPVDPAHWVVTTAYENTDLGALDIARVNFRPALAWIDADNSSQWYMRTDTLTPTGTGDWIFNNLETTAVGSLSLGEIDGVPAIAYVTRNAQTEPVLRYARATKPDPDSVLDWTASDARSSTVGGSGFYSIDMAPGPAGNPSIAYYDDGNNEFYFQHATTTTPAGLGDWTISPIAQAFPIGGNSISLTWITEPIVVLTANGYNVTYAESQTTHPTSESQWAQHALQGFGESDTAIGLHSWGMLVCYVQEHGDLRFAMFTQGSRPQYSRDWKIGTLESGISDMADVRIVSTSSAKELVIFYDPDLQALRAARMVP